MINALCKRISAEVRATERLKKVAVFIVAAFGAQALAQLPPPAPKVFTDAALGFRYTPPPNLRDFTELGRQSIQRRAAQTGTTNTLSLLLSLQSGPDDTAADWHSVTIETYPRDKVHAATDREAGIQFSRWVAAGGTETGQPSDSQVGGFQFIVSTFQLHEGQLTKYSRVYTTVTSGRMLSLAFSAHSADVLDRIADSIKTLSPVNPK